MDLLMGLLMHLVVDQIRQGQNPSELTNDFTCECTCKHVHVTYMYLCI